MTRTKVNLLPDGIEQIRTIEIVGLDPQAGGGTKRIRIELTHSADG